MQHTDLAIFALQRFGAQGDAEAGAGRSVHPTVFDDKSVIDEIEVKA